MVVGTRTTVDTRSLYVEGSGKGFAGRAISKCEEINCQASCGQDFVFIRLR